MQRSSTLDLILILFGCFGLYNILVVIHVTIRHTSENRNIYLFEFYIYEYIKHSHIYIVIDNWIVRCICNLLLYLLYEIEEVIHFLSNSVI